MNEIPDKIKIGGIDYNVIVNPNLAPVRVRYGEYHAFTKEIHIANCHPDQMREALLHEIIEAIDDNCDMQLEHWKISVLSFMLHQILKDNKLVFFNKEEGVKRDD